MTRDQAELFVQFIEKFEVIFDEASQLTDDMESEERLNLRKALSGMIRSRFCIEDIILNQYLEFRDRLRPADPTEF